MINAKMPENNGNVRVILGGEKYADKSAAYRTNRHDNPL